MEGWSRAASPCATKMKRAPWQSRVVGKIKTSKIMHGNALSFSGTTLLILNPAVLFNRAFFGGWKIAVSEENAFFFDLICVPLKIASNCPFLFAIKIIHLKEMCSSLCRGPLSKLIHWAISSPTYHSIDSYRFCYGE